MVYVGCSGLRWVGLLGNVKTNPLQFAVQILFFGFNRDIVVYMV